MKRLISIVSILIMSKICFAQTNIYNLYRPLGSTFSLTNLQFGNYSDLRTPFSNVEKIPVSPSPQKTINLQMINNENDYARIFSLDIKINGNWLFLKGNDEFHRYSEEHSHSQTTRIFFSGALVLGDKIFNDPVLTENAKKLIQDNPDKFVTTYGDYYVSHSRLLKKIFVIIDISNLSGSDIQSLNNVHQGDVDAGFWSVHSDVRVRQILSHAYKNNNCQISLETFGLFNDTLITNITRAVDLEKNNQNFDLLQSLAKNFFDLLQNDANPIHYYSEILNVSDFTPLGVSTSHYDQLNRKSEKIGKYFQLTEQIRQLKQGFDVYTNPLRSWGKILPDNIYNKITANRDLCDFLIDKNLDALKICKESACTTLTDCCNIPTAINSQFLALQNSYQNLLRDYPNDPIILRSFNLEQILNCNASSQINGFRDWKIKFSNPNTINTSGLYKNLKSNGNKTHAFFTCVVYAPDSQFLNLRAKGTLYDFDNNKEISCSSDFKDNLKIVPIYDNTHLQIFGDFVFSNPDDILKIKNIGFLLNFHEMKPDPNVDHSKIVIIGGPTILQGLSFWVQ